MAVDPTHSTRVPAALHPFELVDQRVGSCPGPSADSRSGVQRGGELEDVSRWLNELRADGGGKMLDVREANDLWRSRHDRLREWTQGLDDEIRNDAMLDRVFCAVFQLARQPLILSLGRAACDGACHRLREGTPAGPANEQLGRGARKRGPVRASDQVGEAGGVGGAQGA